MTFGDSVKGFYKNLKVPQGIPRGVEALFPFDNPSTWSAIQQFLDKYYADNQPRTLLMGINPGRFGAGVTGIGFTDPIRLEEDCGIENEFEKKAELSSKFIYDVIHAFGGPKKFYSKFFFSAVSPIGYVKNGKNYNYYDDPLLEKAVEPFAINCLQDKIEFGCSRKVTYSIGQGKNYKFLERINQANSFFSAVKMLPHPRWVMQYRLKRKAEFIDQYLLELEGVAS